MAKIMSTVKLNKIWKKRISEYDLINTKNDLAKKLSKIAYDQPKNIGM